MQLEPLLTKNETTKESVKGLGRTTMVVLFVLFGGMIGAFIHFTLPSRDPVDLGVQTLQMQQANKCVGRCCYPASQPTGRTNVVQAAALAAQLASNKDCVECPEYWNLKMSECPTQNQTVQT